jgi:hypothetical protein
MEELNVERSIDICQVSDGFRGDLPRTASILPMLSFSDDQHASVIGRFSSEALYHLLARQRSIAVCLKLSLYNLPPKVNLPPSASLEIREKLECLLVTRFQLQAGISQSYTLGRLPRAALFIVKTRYSDASSCFGKSDFAY